MNDERKKLSIEFLFSKRKIFSWPSLINADENLLRFQFEIISLLIGSMLNSSMSCTTLDQWAIENSRDESLRIDEEWGNIRHWQISLRLSTNTVLTKLVSASGSTQEILFSSEFRIYWRIVDRCKRIRTLLLWSVEISCVKYCQKTISRKQTFFIYCP